jgi:DNA-binding XRE family transcriptional regulator
MSKSPKKNKVVNERWTNDGMTQNEIAEALGMKRQTVNHIEKTALRKVTRKLNRLYKKEDLL